MQIFSLSGNSHTPSGIKLEHIRSRKIMGGIEPVEVLAANDSRKSLIFTNRADQDALIQIVDSTTLNETPPEGVSVADYSFIIPADSQGFCAMDSTPTGAVKVFYESPADKELVVTEGW